VLAITDLTGTPRSDDTAATSTVPDNIDKIGRPAALTNQVRIPAREQQSP
jgi:hypothetical protein